MTNRQILLAARPEGLPGPECWEFKDGEVPAIKDGEVLVKVQNISLDPAMRGWMNAARSYVPPVRVGQVMRASTTGEVVESKHPGFKAGDQVLGLQGLQQYGKAKGEELEKIDTGRAPAERYLGALGTTGLTAYFGLLDVGALKEGEVVLVSGAAGAVGSVVGQIASIYGCQTIGIAGGSDKCSRLIDEYGYDTAIDYKTENIGKSVMKAARKGVDVFFDNVGGEILNTALLNIKRGARVVICGAISQYNNTAPVDGPSNYMSLLVNRARMEGFVIFDYFERYNEARDKIAAWIDEGKLKVEEDIYTGLDNFPEVFLKLFSGENKGKLVLKID